MEKNYPASRQSDLVVQELENEILIYDLKINKAFCLNETAGLVFELCDGNKNVSEISSLMSAKLRTEVNEELVWLTLSELRKNGLIEGYLETPFFQSSRREMIKRVGLTTMIALPLITSVIAPTSIMAQSEDTTLSIFSPCIIGGPPCDQGTCKNCTGGSCGTGQRRCCISTGSFGPGRVVDTCGLQIQCRDTFSRFCCKGTAIFTANNCGGAPLPTGFCTCT